MKWLLKRAAFVLVAIFLLMQLWRPDRENPPVRREDTIQAGTRMPAEVAAILDRSCKGCHSNEAAWPWYSNIAPVSWIVAHDVEEARKHLNLSEWSRYGNEDGALHLAEMCKEVRSGAMPMGRYVRMHPEAALSAEDRRKLCEWTSAEGLRLLSGGASTSPSGSVTPPEAGSSP